jgi:phage baseplate assembly protein gpV
VPTATWTTIYTFSNTEVKAGMVSFHGLFTHAAVNGSFLKSWDGGTSTLSIATLIASQGGEIRANGNSIQVYHNIGVTLTVNWAIQFIR